MLIILDKEVSSASHASECIIINGTRRHGFYRLYRENGDEPFDHASRLGSRVAMRKSEC